MTIKSQSKIENIEDIRLLVDSFYGKVRQDDILKDIFNERIQNQWPQHLEKMYRFWQTVLLEEHTYNGSPFAPHANMPVDSKHFKQWIKLFTETVDELFSGVVAEEAKWRAGKMAEMFNFKIQYYRNSNEKQIQ